MNWYLDAIRFKYADFTGRAHREEFWMFPLFNILATLAVTLVAFVLHFRLLSSVYALAIIAPHLAVSARRLHDIRRSGWWLLLALIPVLGAIVLFVFFATEGDAGGNDYGPDPRNDG